MRRAGVVVVVVVSLLIPTFARAQSAAIIGTVTDSTGAALPGVTIEASSPALIEGVRVTTTNELGLYRIIELRPGAYTVTFTLPGFQTMRQEGVQLTTGFTATVNVTLAVGAVAESVTVTSETPLVDTVNATVQQVISQDVLQALPLGQQLGALRALLPGAVASNPRTQDVGGNTGESQHGFSINGSRQDDFQQYRDGMLTNSFVAAGNWTSTQNPATTQEVVVTTGGYGATAQTGGGAVNIVQREGGNTFSGSLNVDFSDESLRSDNLTDALRSRGARTESAIRSRYDLGGGIGGPILRDKLWFFSGGRYWTTSSFQPGNFFNATHGTVLYTPDESRPAYELNYYGQSDTKVTWQATEKQKVTGTYVWERSCNCFFSIANGTLSPEAAGSHFYYPNRRIQATWTYPVTDKLLLWAGMTDQFFRHNKRPEGGGTDDQRSILELSRNYRYGAPGQNLGLTGSFGWQKNTQRNQNFTVSYLAGRHYTKVGFTTIQGIQSANRWIFEDMSFRFRNGVPQAVDLWATPYIWGPMEVNYLSVFGEDQWKLGRASLNVGLRYDGLRGSVVEQHLPAGRFVPQRDFDEVRSSPRWDDLNPRVGAAYDLFGTGRTALKASVSRSVIFQPPGTINGIINPVANMVTTATRNWNDLNGDFIPQANELGPLSNARFGTVVRNTNYSPDVLEGWHTREYSWQTSVTIDHQVGQALSVNVGYFRTWFGNFRATDNVAVTPADYDEYCILVPSDSRLPGAGNQICGLYDIRPEKFGRVDNLVVKASQFGDQQDVYNGLSASVNARYGEYRLGGGLSTGATTTDRCFAIDSPEELRFCRNSEDWYAKTQFRLFGVAPLPWRLQASAAFQMLPSIPLAASYVIGNAQVIGLGRPLSGGANATRTIDLIQNNTEFSEGWNRQLDVRLSSNIRAGRLQFTPTLAVYNLLNASSVLGTNTRIGPQFQNVTAVLGSRVVKLGGQIQF